MVGPDGGPLERAFLWKQDRSRGAVSLCAAVRFFLSGAPPESSCSCTTYKSMVFFWAMGWNYFGRALSFYGGAPP
jgi:hypothetical protein